MNYKATIITNTIKIEFGSKSKELLLKRVKREIKKVNEDEVINVSTQIKGFINGRECFTPCYPCEFYSEDFTKEELLEKIECHLDRASCSK